MADGPGGRQAGSGDELRLLAEKATQVALDVGRLREQVQGIVNGVDRRGWNAGAFDDQWARTRFGLGAQSQRFEDDHVELLDRAAEADLLNAPFTGLIEQVELPAGGSL